LIRTLRHGIPMMRSRRIGAKLPSERLSLAEVYWRALTYLSPAKRQVAIICLANIVLAMVVIAEPVLFGRIIDAISEKRDVVPTLALWAGFGLFNIVAFVAVARQADRLAHRMRVDVLTRSFGNVMTMPLSWHYQRGTSNVLHTLLRAVDTLFSLWLEFMRTHLVTAVSLILLIPTAIALDWRLSLVLFALGAAYIMIGRFVMRRTEQNQKSVEQHHHRVFRPCLGFGRQCRLLQSYNRVQQETQALRSHVEKLLTAQYPVLDWWALASGMHRVASTLSMMVVLVIGALLVSRGELKVGDIVAFTGFAALLISRLDQVSAFANQIFDARAKLEEFYKLEDATEMRVGAGRQRDARQGHRPCPLRQCVVPVPELGSWRRNMSRSPSSQARRSPSSGRPAPARRRWSTCCSASTTRSRAKSSLTASTPARSHAPRCAIRSRPCSRIRGC
jgi:glucan exporter ATP-binding protein